MGIQKNNYRHSNMRFISFIGFLAALGSIKASNFSNIYESAGYQVHVPIEYNDQSCIQGTFHPNSTNLFTVEIISPENETPGGGPQKHHYKSKRKLSINSGLTTCYRSGLNGKSSCVSELELETGIMKKGCSQDFMPETGAVSHPCGGKKSGFVCVHDNRPMSNFHTNLMVTEWKMKMDRMFFGKILNLVVVLLVIAVGYKFFKCFCDTGIPALKKFTEGTALDFNLKLSITPNEQRVEPVTV